MSHSIAIVVLGAISVLLVGCTGDAVATNPGAAEADAAIDSRLDGTVCVASSCTTLGAGCGQAPDGCGGVVACGTCPTGSICGGGGPNRCGTSPCTAVKCQDVGAQCGDISNGCGVVIQCGSCPSTKTCSANQCVGSDPGDGCTPTTCAALGLHCGSAPDGCGGNMSCGSCPGNQACISGNCGCNIGEHLCDVVCIADGSCCTSADCTGMAACAAAGGSCVCPTSPARQPIFRSLAPSGDHLLSASQAEGPGLGYSDEGVRFYDYASPCSWGLTPLLRIKNPKSGEHFYTTSPQERDTLVVSGWTDEGDIGCIAPSALCSSVELFRLVQMWHLYTVDVNERNTLVAAGWTQEWSPGFVWMSP